MHVGKIALVVLVGLFASFGGTPVSAASEQMQERVQGMYVSYYGRPGDPGGVDYWADRLEATNGNLAAIIDAFGNSQEYQDRFAHLDNIQLVNNVFRQLFGRDADYAGLEFYTAKLDQGEMTLAGIALNILDGVRPGNSDYQTVDNKLNLSMYFTQQVSSGQFQYNASSLSYAAALMADIDERDCSLHRALTITDGFSGTEDYEPEQACEVYSEKYSAGENATGEQLWQQLGCIACHGVDGDGNTSLLSALNNPQLAQIIELEMPLGNAESCDADCAQTLANWMTTSLAGNSEEDELEGAGLWQQQECYVCHGDYGDGMTPVLAALSNPNLATFIEQNMPYGNASSCDAACGQTLADWMTANFGAEMDGSNSGSEDNGTPELPSDTPPVNSGDGGEMYMARCASCHGADGQGSRPIVNAMRRVDLVDYVAANMPYGVPANCDFGCSELITDWMMENFEAPAGGADIVPPTVDISEVLAAVPQSKAPQLLYKASLNLLGRLPTAPEYATIDAQGSIALSALIDAQLEDDAFVERVKDIFNDLLLTQEWDHKDAFHSFMRNYSWNSFDNGDAEWIKETKGIPYYTKIRRYISNGHSRSPLELVGYLVENDLPFSEILTADYAMLNWYSAKSFGLEQTANFRDLPFDEQLNKDFPKDPTHFLPVQLPRVPSAGVLTTGVYMLKYRTTKSNRNRNRAYTLFKQFLDTDILEIGGERPGDSDSSHENPTLTDPNCTGCHRVMDPVASSFKHWISFAGMGRPYYDASPSGNDWNSSTIRAAGFNGEAAPENVSPLPWVAGKIVQDPRFARAMVKAVFAPLTGVPLLPATFDGVEFQSQAYLEQQAFIAAMAEAFATSGYNFKAMVKNLVLSEYTLGQHSGAMSDLLITPVQLNNKITSTLGQGWDNWLSTWNILYGGIDSGSVTVRNQTPNGVIATIQLRMAEDMACKVTAREFSTPAAERLLLRNIEPDMTADTGAGEAAIRQAMVEIYQRLIGEQLSSNDDTIDLAFSVYTEALELGQAGIASGDINTQIANDCRVRRNSAVVNKDFVDQDANYFTRAWQAVIQFALMDPRFFYI